MEELRAFIDFLYSLDERVLEQKLLEFLKDYKAEMLDLERVRLLEGKRADDSDITPQYASFSYANYKLKFNPLGVVDLTLTGAFVKAFTVDLSAFPIVFFGTDIKTTQLVAKYGEEIFGEREEDLEIIREYLARRFAEWFESVLVIR